MAFLPSVLSLLLLGCSQPAPAPHPVTQANGKVRMQTPQEAATEQALKKDPSFQHLLDNIHTAEQPK